MEALAIIHTRIYSKMFALQKLDYLLPFSVLMLGVLFAPEWQAYFDLWYNSIVYSHGFIVLALSLYLLWRQWPELTRASLAPSMSGFAALIANCMILLLAKAADIKTITLVILPFVILSWGWALWGLRFIRTSGVAALLLVYAAPVWDDFSPFFQLITVFANQILLSAFNIPAEIRELYISIPSGTFYVAGGCSGVRYLMVALCLGTVYGSLFYRSVRLTILLTLIAGLLSMVANWIRVFGIIVAGHVTEMESSLVEDHEAFGWIVFVIVALVPFFFIARRIEENIEPATSEEIAERGTSVTGTATNSKVKVSAILVSFLLLTAVPVTFYTQTVFLVETDSTRLPDLPPAPPDWRGPLQFAEFWEPDYHNEDLNVSGIYVSQNLQKVQLQITGYLTQGQAKELIYHRNRLFNPDSWQLMSSRVIQVEPNRMGVNEVNESILEHNEDQERIIVWSWFYLDGYQSPSTLKAKLVGGIHKLLRDGSGALVALAAECDQGTCDQQKTDMMSFIAEIEL